MMPREKKMFQKPVYNKPEVLSFQEGDVLELLGVAETQYFTEMTVDQCLCSDLNVGHSVQDEYTFFAPAGAVINITVDVPSKAVCPPAPCAPSGPDCPLHPELAICEGLMSPPPAPNPACVYATDNMACTDATLGNTCAQIVSYTAPATGFYTIGVGPATIFVDPAATGCYTLDIKSDLPLGDFEQTVFDGANTFLRR